MTEETAAIKAVGSAVDALNQAIREATFKHGLTVEINILESHRVESRDPVPFVSGAVYKMLVGQS